MPVGQDLIENLLKPLFIKNMKVEILKDQENPLLNRREAEAKVEHPGARTPNRLELLPVLAKTLKADEKLIIIDKIITMTGTNTSRVKIQVYKKLEDIPKQKLEKMERRIKKIKQEAEKAEKPEEKKEGEEKAEEEKAEKKEEGEEKAEGKDG